MRLRWLVPPAPFLGMLLRRSAALWLIGRLMAAAFAFLLSQSPHAEPVTVADVLCLGTTTSLAFAALVAGLAFLDVLRRHEVILLANLGVSRSSIVGLAALPPLLLEALTCLILV